MKKVVVYIDGSNFYFSVKKKFKVKIDIKKFCEKLSKENDLIKINIILLLLFKKVIQKCMQNNKVSLIN